jgi:hypothetical protein
MAKVEGMVPDKYCCHQLEMLTFFKLRKSILETIYIYIYIYRERERERERDREYMYLQSMSNKITNRLNSELESWY